MGECKMKSSMSILASAKHTKTLDHGNSGLAQSAVFLSTTTPPLTRARGLLLGFEGDEAAQALIETHFVERTFAAPPTKQTASFLAFSGIWSPPFMRH